MQVHKAFELLSRSGEVDVPDSRYDIKVKRSDRSLYSRGIYLREPLDAVQATSHIVDVTPRLKEVIPLHLHLLLTPVVTQCRG